MRLALTVAALALTGCGIAPNQEAIQKALDARGHLVRLPSGTIEVSSELRLPDDAQDMEIRGAAFGTTLRAAAGFQGRAIFTARGATRVKFRDFSIEGNRAALEQRTGLPPYDVPFARFTRNNGILGERVTSFKVINIRFREIAGFAVLVSGGREVSLEYLHVNDSGSRNPVGRNNTTGGILLEEGVENFEVVHCELKNILGNAIWTHSLYTSKRNGGGFIIQNKIDTVGRDAIQVGHATGVRVQRNTAVRTGYPDAAIDLEGRAYPAAIDTAGNTDRTIYSDNRIEETNGKCIDLDGFHDGEVRGNVCINRGPPEQYPHGNYGIVMNNSNPDMESRNIVIAGNQIERPLFGGIFVIGTGHRIEGNRLKGINQARCNEGAARFGCYYGAGEPDMLRAGIYLGRGAERPAVAMGNTIQDNDISGFEMAKRCVVAAPGVTAAANTILRNRCTDQ